MDKEQRERILEKVKNCKHENRVVKNYDPVWRDGDVHCEDCGVYIRMYDAG